jgi:adiponectin receptor
MSSRTYTITNRFDYAGVNLLISGSAFPPLYYGLYCQLAVATLYLTLILITATFCFVVCLFEWIHRPGHEKYKAFLFGGFGVSMIIPISHMLINEIIYDNYGDPFEFSTSLPYYLLLGASYLTGLYVYTVRCPERNNPGKYNICGHSHQIWHGMVVLGIFFTYLGVLQNF